MVSRVSGSASDASPSTSARRRSPSSCTYIVEAVWKTTSCVPGTPVGEESREFLDVIAPGQLRRVVAQDVDRPPQALEPDGLIGPHERLKQPGTVLGRRVDRAQIDAASPRDRDVPPKQLGGRRHAIVTRELEHALAPRARRVAVAVAIPQQIEPGGRAELEQVERASIGQRQEARQDAPRALHLVRLHALLRSPALQELRVLLERDADLVPRGVTGEHEIVQTAEETQRKVPREIGRDRADPRIFREPATKVGVERRAAVAVRRLPLEDLALPGYFAAASADLACSTISLNLPGSVAARSASTFRSSSTFAIFKPDMNWL